MVKKYLCSLLLMVFGAKTVTVTHNDILTALNTPEGFILGLVEVSDYNTAMPRYNVRRPFLKESDFRAISVNYGLGDLMERAEPPS